MKKQAIQLFAVLLSMLTVCSFLIPYGSCETISHREEFGSSHDASTDIEEGNTRTEILDEYKNNFGYVVVEAVYEEDPSGCISNGAAMHSVKHVKNVTQYTPERKKVFTVTLTAYFDYDYSRATCTSANTSVEFFSSGWRVKSNDTSFSNDTATADVWLSTNVTGVWLRAAHVTINIVCGKDGTMH